MTPLQVDGLVPVTPGARGDASSVPGLSSGPDQGAEEETHRAGVGSLGFLSSLGPALPKPSEPWPWGSQRLCDMGGADCLTGRWRSAGPSAPLPSGRLGRAGSPNPGILPCSLSVSPTLKLPRAAGQWPAHQHAKTCEPQRAQGLGSCVRGKEKPNPRFMTYR